MDRFEISKTYTAEAEISICEGCVGEYDLDLCDVLPPCMSLLRADDREIIWVEEAE